MTASEDTSPTGIVLMNLGGPKDLDQVQPFLLELFSDREIIQLPAQNVLGPFIAKRHRWRQPDTRVDLPPGSRHV